MELTKFCPKCGKEKEKLHGNKGLCGSCYTENVELLDLPDIISIIECQCCEKIKSNGRWHSINTRRDRIVLKLEEYTEDEVEIDEIEFEVSDTRNNMSLDLQIKRGALSETKNLDLVLKQKKCRQCRNFEGDYAKTKIQIRGEKNSKIQQTVENRASNLEKNNHEDFLLDRKNVKGGVDFFLSTEHMSQKIIYTVKQKHQVNIERSYQKIGKKDGREIYQNTVVLRMDKDS